MAGPVFNVEFDPLYGQAVEVSPLLRRVVCNNPSKFTFHGTGTYVIGHGDVAVVDPGPRDPVHVDALLRALDGETVHHILITHTHGDHSPAAEALAEATGAPVLGFGPHPDSAIGEDEEDDDDEDEDDHVEPISDDPHFAEKHRPDIDFEPDSPLAHGDVVEGPGYTVEALHTPGHISNHLCFALREENSLLCGDHVMGWSTTIIPPPDGDLAAYLGSLELLLERSDARLYPTHGAPIDEPQPYVQEIVAVLYADVPKVLHKPAARSVVAHLRKLHDEATITPAVAGASTLKSKTTWCRP